MDEPKVGHSFPFHPEWDGRRPSQRQFSTPAPTMATTQGAVPTWGGRNRADSSTATLRERPIATPRPHPLQARVRWKLHSLEFLLSGSRSLGEMRMISSCTLIGTCSAKFRVGLASRHIGAPRGVEDTYWVGSIDRTTIRRVLHLVDCVAMEMNERSGPRLTLSWGSLCERGMRDRIQTRNKFILALL